MFPGFFYCYFKGINLLKNRELTFRSLHWTIIDVLGPEFDSWVLPWSHFGDGYITSQLAWTAWLILCGHEMGRCVEEISWFCILIQGEFSTHPLHCTLYSARQTSSLFSSKTILQFTRNWISTWNQFRPLGYSSSAKSEPSKKDKLVFQRLRKKFANKLVTGPHCMKSWISNS